ncbi:unnamed protein product, partial [Nesidiocoris tenuis]
MFRLVQNKHNSYNNKSGIQATSNLKCHWPSVVPRVEKTSLEVLPREGTQHEQTDLDNFRTGQTII